MNIIVLLLTIAILLGISFFCFKQAITLSKSKNKTTDSKITKPVIGMYKHTTGLSLPEGASCKLYIHDEKIMIESNGIKFNLYKNKILNVCIKTETEIQKQYVSSVGSAIAGGTLFGPLGAIIGGRVKEKKSKSTTRYLIYTYEKDNEIDYIAFDILNGINSHKFVSDFINNPNNINKEVTL